MSKYSSEILDLTISTKEVSWGCWIYAVKLLVEEEEEEEEEEEGEGGEATAAE